jgi:hypothetical protein
MLPHFHHATLERREVVECEVSNVTDKEKLVSLYSFLLFIYFGESMSDNHTLLQRRKGNISSSVPRGFFFWQTALMISHCI